MSTRPTISRSGVFCAPSNQPPLIPPHPTSTTLSLSATMHYSSNIKSNHPKSHPETEARQAHGQLRKIRGRRNTKDSQQKDTPPDPFSQDKPAPSPNHRHAYCAN